MTWSVLTVGCSSSANQVLLYGSLPGIGVHVNDIVGMVTTSDDRGYYLVGPDGGVFAFGDANFEGSLPGIGVLVNNIVGISPTTDNGGYFLVGKDGGVFSFGDAPLRDRFPDLAPTSTTSSASPHRR